MINIPEKEVHTIKVLLTGASGFIGRYVLEQLHANKIETIVLGRTRPEYIGSSKFICVDLLEETHLDDLIKQSDTTHLMHLAWYAEHGDYWMSSLNLRWVEASVRLVEAFCRNGGQKVIAAGTCAEYDWSYGFCREDITPIEPVKLYGVAKDATRRLISELCAAQNVKFAWGRIFIPYGKGENSKRLIPSLIDVFRKKKKPFGVNALAYRDFLHVADLAKAFIKLLQKDTSGIYNICSGQPVQIGNVVEVIADAFNSDPAPIFQLSTSRNNEPRLLVGDNNKLQLLNWQPEHTFLEFKSVDDY